ncbi:MAG: OprD family outer membrane porin [Campylobacterota bacterium]|nr:OprD family outer membrane porin [Campylobacterota bacterium]
MKKHIAISAIVVGLLGSTNLCAAEELSSMFSEGKVSGQIREYSISRTMDYSSSTKDDYTRSANAIGGHLKFETADYKGLSFGTAFYTTNGFLIPDDKAHTHSGGGTYSKIDPTLLGQDNDGYSILGEVYLNFKYGNTAFKAGRQKLSTPMAGADDARMIPNLFEAYVLSNTDIPDTTLIVAHATKFAQGTFGRAYAGGANAANTILSATAGYSAVDSRDQVGDFVNMGTYVLGTATDGVSVLSATYTGIKNLKVQLWDYYAYDILNAIYGQVDYKWNCLISDSVKPFVSAQIIKEDDVGDKLLKNLGGNGKIDSMYWGAKVGAKVENFTAYVAYSEVGNNSDTDEAYSNAIISPWGGMPAFTQGMVTRHVFLAGTKATKVAASYNWKAFGPDLKTVLYYANYDMADNNGYTSDDASETGFDFIYKPSYVKNLNLRLRGNFADDFNVNATGDTVGWNEYRFIANYNF